MSMILAGTENEKLLLKTYSKNPYPTTNEKIKLAEICDLTIKQINNWFRKQRRTDRQNNNNIKINKRFNNKQRIILRNYYSQNKSVQALDLPKLAEQVGSSIKQVEKWFKYKRKYEKSKNNKLKMQYKLKISFILNPIN